MRKVLKWVGIVVGSLIGLAILAIAGVVLLGQLTFKQQVNRPIYEIAANTSEEGIARGEYLVRNVMGCGDCHAVDRLDPVLAGRVERITSGPIQLLFAGPNLTNHETGLAQWTDSEIARAIREGVDRDGRSLLIMPSFNYREMSDEDTAAIIGYLRSLEPVDKPIPDIEVNWIGKAFLVLGLFPKSIAPVVDAPVHAPQMDSMEYGRYLAVLGGCRDCHGVNHDGTKPMNAPPGYSAPNISGNGVLAFWTEDQFIQTIRSGTTPTGKQLSDEMPWKVYGRMNDEDLRLIYRYLSTLNSQSASQ